MNNLSRHSFHFAALVALILLVPAPLQAALTEAWVHRYNNVVNNSLDQAAKVVRDAADNIIVTGTSGSDMLTLKYSGADGSVLWQRRYNGTASGEVSTAASALAVDGSGNVVVTGYSHNALDQGLYPDSTDFYTAKYAASDGALLWERRYNGPANLYDAAYAVAVNSSGNVVVAGTSRDVLYSDYYTAKYAAADGALLWEKRHKGSGAIYNFPWAVAVDGSDNVVVTGFFDYYFYTAKYAAANGALLWEKLYNGPDNTFGYARAVAIDGNSNVVVTGESGGQFYTAKYASASGALLWEQRHNEEESNGNRPRAVALDGSGNVVVTGFFANQFYTAKYSSANGALLWEQRNNGGAATAVAVDASGNVVVTGGSFNGTNYDCYTAKYAATDGGLLWEKRSNAGGFDTSEEWIRVPGSSPYSVAFDSSGNVVVTGSSDNGSGTSFDYNTAKYAAADGALLWEKRYNGDPVNHDDLAKAVVVDGSGNVVVTGTSPGIDDYYYTAKYGAVDGALIWEKRYRDTGVQAMAVDGNGNVVVTGDAFSGTSWDYYTAKYAAANGALLWEKRYNGPANLGDEAHAVAVDGSGNVVVTGKSASSGTWGGGGVHDFYTAKYAAADGALLWEKRYNGPANLNDVANAVAVDASGNVVVTGGSAASGSPNSGFSHDYYTAKYAAADGALLWGKRYNGPANGHDEARAVVVDVSGNVVVTGESYNGTDYDYFTAKYAAADGALLWEKRYDGPAKGWDFADAVALDDRGNVVVTGRSATSGSVSNGFSYDYFTARYAAADGTLLWEKRYNGPANLNDIAVPVRVDGNGNVVVTGRSASRRLASGGFINDYYTAKYAAADGALLWEKRYNGPANGDDYPSSLALGPNGMVVVTGISAGYGAGYDFATVVYREALPPVSIERVSIGVRLRFAGTPGRSHNVERALAVIGPWSTINTQTAPASGLLECIDANAPTGTAFYRTREP